MLILMKHVGRMMKRYIIPVTVVAALVVAITITSFIVASVAQEEFTTEVETTAEVMTATTVVTTKAETTTRVRTARMETATAETTKMVVMTKVETTTAEPTTAEPTTAEPTTAEPTTAETTTAEPTTIADEDEFEAIVIDDDELDLLAHLIYAEGGDQSDDCQRAIGTVVMNRVASPNFPNTMYGVIYQSGQYACTWDGGIYKTPSQRAYDNARWILEGNRYFDSAYVFQAQFVQGYDCIWIGSECFGKG